MASYLSLQVLADLAGVSKMTVSRALRGASGVSREVREKILDLAVTHGYRRNPTVDVLMTQLRSQRQMKFKANLSFLDFRSPKLSASLSADGEVLAGAKERAWEFGYVLDVFYKHDLELSPERLKKVFATRNIKGIAVLDPDRQEQNIQRIQDLLRLYPCVCVGHTPMIATFAYCMNDIYSSLRLAIDQLISRGYRRIALTADDSYDQRGGRSGSAAYLAACLARGLETLPILYTRNGSGISTTFKQWFQKAKPEVVITDTALTMDFLKELNLRVPEDVGIAHLNIIPSNHSWAGIVQQNRKLGHSIVDNLINQIQLLQRGPSEFSAGTMVIGKWQDGITLKKSSI